MSVSEILKHCTNQLVQYLSWELQIASIKNLEKILVRTLVQIFIEEKIYKKIEKCTDKSSMFSEVRNGLEKFRKEWYPIVQKLFDMSSNGPHIMPIGKETQKRLDQLEGGIIPDIDIEHLLEIPIRRIAAFEIEKNRKEISLEQKGLDENLRNLKKIKSYTIKYLQGILDKYGSLYPRRSKITIDGFEKIDKRAIALNNIRVGWDKKNCYIGTNVKSDEVVICNDFDHLLCIERNGSFKIINIPTKIFIDRLYEFRKYDKNTVFGIVYSDKKSGKVYAKRSAISSFTVDREYRLIPENCKLEVITSRPNAIYEIIIDTPIKSKQKIVYNLLDAPQRSSKAGGILVSNRKMLKISFSQYTDNTGESSAERDLVNVSTQEESISSKKSQNEENSDDKKEIISSEVKIEREEDSWKAQPDLGF